MTRYIALLRAVNVGGTGKLPMSELRAMCCDAGFARVETYIASGNVVFESKAAPSRVKAELEGRLHATLRSPLVLWCVRHQKCWPFWRPIRFLRLNRNTHTLFS